jgi:tRNA-2-methylthio-N6-dimethylallyladenosine synthase
VIVGFPGESESDFQETMELCSELRFLAAYSFKYSKRPGTPAADMSDQIPEEIVADRYDRLHKRLNEVSLSVNEEAIGQDSEVLITDVEGNTAQGKSRDFRLVHLDIAADEARPGDIARVKIKSAKPHFIFGEKLAIKKTRGGDAFELRKLEAENNGVFLGVPQLKSSLVK